jgi:ankyrin repeat protein
MEYLIENGANINILDNEEQTPLFHACQFDKREIAELLIKNGALIDTQDSDGESPLLIACRNGSIEIAKLLIDQGANLSIQDDDGESPLFLAYQSGKKELIDLLCVRFIENFYDNFVKLDIEKFRQKIIDSIDNTQMFVIQWGHLKAFKSMRSIDSLKELKEKNILEYFASYEFQEKYILDLVNTLNEQKESLHIAKTKLIYRFPNVKSKNLNKSKLLKSEESIFYYSLSYSDISELIKNNTLIDFVMQSTEQTKMRNAVLVFRKIQSFSQVVEKNLQLSRYLLEFLTQKEILEFLKLK